MFFDCAPKVTKPRRSVFRKDAHTPLRQCILVECGTDLGGVGKRIDKRLLAADRRVQFEDPEDI